MVKLTLMARKRLMGLHVLSQVANNYRKKLLQLTDIFSSFLYNVR